MPPDFVVDEVAEETMLEESTLDGPYGMDVADVSSTSDVVGVGTDTNTLQVASVQALMVNKVASVRASQLLILGFIKALEVASVRASLEVASVQV